MVSTLGLMALLMMVVGLMKKSMVMVLIFGLMDASTMDSGRTVLCTVMEFTFIKMVLDLTDNIRMIKKKVLVIIIGMTLESTLAGGLKVNNTALAPSSTKRRNSKNKDFGNSVTN